MQFEETSIEIPPGLAPLEIPPEQDFICSREKRNSIRSPMLVHKDINHNNASMFDSFGQATLFQ